MKSNKWPCLLLFSVIAMMYVSPSCLPLLPAPVPGVALVLGVFVWPPVPRFPVLGVCKVRGVIPPVSRLAFLPPLKARGVCNEACCMPLQRGFWPKFSKKFFTRWRESSVDLPAKKLGHRPGKFPEPRRMHTLQNPDSPSLEFQITFL
jgi:hypothetical protein